MISTTDVDRSEELQEEMKCPTCGARQVPADECRRCRTDLRMVRRAQQQYRETYLHALARLKSRRLKRATDAAIRCRQMSVDESSTRLLAVCYALQGNFAAALQVYHQSTDRQKS